MSFILVPNLGEDIQINGWNWRPTLRLLEESGILSEEQLERMGAQGAGGEVDADQAMGLAEFLTEFLRGKDPSHRLRLDLTFTDAPKDFSKKITDMELEELYSAWLSQFRDFCNRCQGFRVV